MTRLQACKNKAKCIRSWQENHKLGPCGIDRAIARCSLKDLALGKKSSYYHMACVCSRSNARSDWVIINYLLTYSPTNIIVTRDCVTYVIVTSNQYLFVFLLYPSILSFIRYMTRVLDTCQLYRKINRRIVAIKKERGIWFCLVFYLDQLPTLVLSNARFVMLIIVCIAGMRATRTSVKIVSFGLIL